METSSSISLPDFKGIIIVEILQSPAI